MKPRVPKGTRDYSPAVVRKRQFIFDILRQTFEQFGFEPIETPAFEQLDTLMGKYGEEGDRLIFKILNNGLNNPNKEQKARAAFENVLVGKSDKNITERALRYDLTIPFARYVVMYQNDLAFPFRRYQMQPVWRADRPQKGRYREFWQCDADIIGSRSLINEAELLGIYAQALSALKIPDISLKVNNRKILAGLAECCEASERLTDITIVIDKMDKIGIEGVIKALVELGLTKKQNDFIQKYLLNEGDNKDKFAKMENLLGHNETAKKGLEELKETFSIFKTISNADKNIKVVFDSSLARGLDYYTGFIVEVTTNATKMGSLGGGGRYDDLTGLFGLKNLSGVGVSFGVNRIFDVMETLALFPKTITRSNTDILFLNVYAEAQASLLKIVQQLRQKGITAEIYADTKKIDKQMKYANKRDIPFVAIMGETEFGKDIVQLKNMLNGEQNPVAANQFADAFQKVLLSEKGRSGNL